MAVTEMTLPNLSEDPLWQILHEELSNLLDELTEDPKYREHVTLIRALLAHPQCLRAEQLYFVPQMRPWPTSKRS
jgi:hypothetical protein